MDTEMQSAVRIPSPEPAAAPIENLNGSAVKRKRPSDSRSPSPRRYRSPPRGRPRTRSPDGGAPLPQDVDRERAMERRRQLELRHKEQDEAAAKPMTEEQKQEAAKAEYNKLLNMRSGGTYIPPAKLRALQAQVTDKSSKEYQRMAWEALKKSIQGIINKANSGNMKMLVPELFEENLMRGRGVFCRSIMRAQMASLPFTPIYACMAAAVNTKLPPIGELLVTRLIINFKKGFRRNDRAVCVSTTTFLAHLTNFQVVHELLVVEMLVLLLQKPTDDSVEISVALLKECGQHLEEFSPKMAMLVYDQLRSVLHEADIEKRTQYAIEVLFQIRKDRYKNNPAVREDLDIIDEEDQITHKIALDAKGLQTQDTLNVFKFDENYEQTEAEWKHLKAQILGEVEGSDEEEDEDDEEESSDEEDVQEKQLEIKDQSNRDLSDLRKSIYLTMVSSGGYEEACTRLMRIKPPAGLESEIPSMIIETCIQQKTYDKYYGMIGERFCKLNRFWRDEFEASFAKYYDTSHRLDNNRLRIAGQFFGHLLATDAIGLHVLSVVRLTQEDTNSSNRIFLKYIFEDIIGNIGMKKLVERMRDETLQMSLQGVFPKDTKENLRFSINYFTAIGMGPLTEDMREYLKNMPTPAPPALPAPEESDYSDTASSYSSYSSRSRSYSRSRSPSTPPRRRHRDSDSLSRSPPRRGRTRSRSVSYSRSPSPAPRRRDARSRSRSASYTPPPRRRGGRTRSYTPSVSRSPSRSVTPPRRRAGRRDSVSASRSRSRSPPPRRRAARSYTRSVTPPRRRDSRSYTRSVTPPRRRAARNDSVSRSRSPTPRRYRSPTRSVTPPRRRAARDSVSRSRSRSRSPPPKRTERAPRELSRSPLPKRRRNSPSVEASPPPKRERALRDGSRSPPPKRRRNTSSAEGSPPRRGEGKDRARASDYL